MTQSPPPQPSPFEGEGVDGVAIVGMAGRFGGAASVEAFWDGLCRGEDWVRTLSREELLAAGEDPEALADPAYVPRRAVLPDADRFAAPFFDVTPREAEITDPQQRLLLECAWEALEDAGLDTERCDGLVGVYASASVSTYHQRVLQHRGLAHAVGSIPSELGNDTDYLATRISYKLDLRGPSMSVQTACSSSLVAVHVAVQSLLRGECDVALAGAASVQVPQAGYHYREGSIASPDGRCRTFDAAANGAVGGSGVGMVVLRRLADAEAEGHHVYAVIRGSAVNNDGSGKVGFTAPGLQGQAEVIAEAQAVAGVSPRSITYIEAHGTGTALGDPVEVKALTRAFRAGTPDAGFCAIGSVKTNLGHLDAAAGVAGLVKAALAVHHGRIPPSLHFARPNPACELEGSPFVVASTLREWDAEPRRAGVSSFGLGGTNAHVVLEQAPPPPATSTARPGHLLLLSARTPAALAAAAANLAGHLERRPEQDLADVAHTLRVGRRQLEHRLALVCAGREEAVRALREGAGALGERPRREPPVVFLLPGQGAQHAGMGRDLYRHEPAFRAWVDRCAGVLAPELGGLDLRDALYGEAAAPELDETWLAQPALFVTSYALARTLMDWGVRPAAMIGHSLGEYVAACLAGVLDLEDALRVVALRGRLMQAAPRGAMAGVALGEDELRGVLPAGLALAAVNGPRQCVVSGPEPAVAAFEARLGDAGVRTRRLRTSHAFHSALQGPAVPQLVEALGRVRLRPPALRYVSNLTGGWVTPAQATDPAAWGRQLRETVRFGDGVRTLAADPEAVLVEVGPGTGLSGLARQQVEPGRVVATMRHADDPRPDRAALLDGLGRLWVAGAAVDWAAFGRPERRRLLPLPRYPFERQRYWIGAAPANGHANGDAPALVAYPRAAGLPAYVAPRTTAEERVAEVWRELIGTDRIGATDDFFLLGGTSLTATQLVARLGETFGLDLPLRLVFEHPTVGAMALAVEDRLLAEIEAMEEVADGV